VLYSNHLDQHTNDQINPKLADTVRTRTVLVWLTSAKALRKGYDTPRELSTLAQLDHYYGKALRYKETPLSEVECVQETSVVLASVLNEKLCDEAEDPHQFPGRIESYELPFVYTLQKLKKYDYALAILQRHIVSAPDAFLKVQALVQYAKTCCLEGLPEKGLSQAQEAYDLANANQKSLRFNAAQALMECLWDLGEKDKAVELASQLLEEQEKNPNCGIKDFHILAANLIVERYQQASNRIKI
jgi:tetratricopeptide (TPR) repeat protein